MNKARFYNKYPIDYLVRYKYKNTDYIIAVIFLDDIIGNSRGIYVNGEKIGENFYNLEDYKKNILVEVVI